MGVSIIIVEPSKIAKIYVKMLLLLNGIYAYVSAIGFGKYSSPSLRESMRFGIQDNFAQIVSYHYITYP